MRVVLSAVLLLIALLGVQVSHAQDNAPTSRDPAIDRPADPAPPAGQDTMEPGGVEQAPLAETTSAPGNEPVVPAAVPPEADAESQSDGRIGPAPALPSLVVDDPAAEAERVVNQFHEALRSGARAALLATLAPEFTVFNNGKAAHSRSDYEAALLTDELQDAQSAQRQPVRREVLSSGDTVWVLSEWRVTRALAGSEILFDEAETMLLRWHADSWTIVHRHLSARPIAP